MTQTSPMTQKILTASMNRLTLKEYKSYFEGATMKERLVTLIRAMALIGGIGCLLAFWSTDTVLQQIAWAAYATALFALVVALKD
jgi:hypothetical protein